MEGTNLLVLFVVGFVLGCTIVMLLWMASPGCILSQDSGGEGALAGTPANLTYPGGSSSSMVIRDSSGARTLATTGDRGTPSTFTDENGRTRDVVCYTSYYCIDQTPCEEEECVQLSQRCGEWPAGTGTFTAATNMGGTTDYGDCCDPYRCVDGYCSQESCVQERGKCTYDNDCCEGQCTNGVCTQEECQQQNDMCGLIYPTQTATTAYNPNPVDYGECCPPYECVGNRCGGEEQCVETGETCGTTYPVGATANYPIDNGECCPPDECINNVCTSEEPCVETGALCGYGPPVYSTAAPANRTWHGDCCSGDTCVDGYCQPQCADMGNKCTSTLACCEGYCVSGVCKSCTPGGYDCKKDEDCCQGYSCVDGECGTESACMQQYSECSKDSDCCNGLVCFDGTCQEEGVCGEEGQTCGLQVECCGDLECSDNDICIECAAVGETCGGQYTTGAPSIPCCSTGYCYSGVCQQRADELCTDTENGPDYYNEGSATGEYQGDYGTYTDYCGGTGASVLYEYYCEVPGDYSAIELAIITCPNGCSGGQCK